MKRDTLNEETAKVHLISYFKERLGLSLDDLEAEREFSIWLGTFERKVQRHRGRLDLLIRRHGRNLCVVELKAEGKPLTEEDRKQAISYALLLDQRAPVVFLSNGVESCLYDVWTEKLLNDTLPSVDSLYKTVPPDDFLFRREEALALFLRLSSENLLVFCREQVTSRMQYLRGTEKERDRKYIPDLFVPRGRFRESIGSFLAGTHSLFVLTGDAGVGKTCELCALAEYLLEQGTPVLFYRGSTLGKDQLLRNIADDFAWTFADEESPRNLLRRLGSLLPDGKLLVIIDAIDEWDCATRMQDLLETSRRLSGKNVKLLVSCKTLAWPEFAKRRSIPTGIQEYLYGGQPQLLPPMSDTEQWRAIDKYRIFYNVHGAFETRALRAAQESPFILRLLFEVASERRDEHIMFSSLQFFDHYYNQLVSRLDDAERGSYVLKLAARLLFEQGTESLALDVLYREAGFEMANAILPELVNFQIMERAGNERSASVRFYFSLLRDYLVAFHVYPWQELEDSALRDALKDSLQSGVRVEALAFFYRYSDPTKQRVLCGDLVDMAREYLHLYDRVLRENFPGLRASFSPFTDGEIGFVGELIVDNLYMGYYGFREREPNNVEVLLIPLARFDKHESNLLPLYGVQSEKAIGYFEHIDVGREVFEYEIGSRLRELVDKGLLDEGCAPDLAAEVIACAVSRDRNVFSDKRAASAAGPLLPIDIASVKRWWKYELLNHHFLNLCFQRKFEEKGEGATGISSEEFTFEDWEWIRQSTERSLMEPDEVVRSWARPEGNNLDLHLARAFATLDSAGISVIEGHPVLPLSDPKVWMWMSYPRAHREEICRYVERVLGYALPLAKRLIEHNFPSLYQEFPTIKNGPFVGVVEVHFESESRMGPFGTLYQCEPDTGAQETTFVARDRENIQKRITRDPDFRFEVCCDGVWRLRMDRALVGQRHVRIQSLLRPSHDYLGFRGYFSGSGEIQPVVRAVVYDWIRQELDYVFQVLCDRYGVAPDKSRWALFGQSRN